MTVLLAHIGVVPVEEFLGPLTSGAWTGVLVAFGSLGSILSYRRQQRRSR